MRGALLWLTLVLLGCNSGKESPTLQGSNACTIPGMGQCGDGCTDLQTDSSNCGSCQHSCAATEVCVAATCQCPSGSTTCATGCYRLDRDPSNCGACGEVCANAGVCYQGRCAAQCPSGLTECHGSCFDLRSDPSHCGDCSIDCGGDRCIDGFCG